MHPESGTCIWSVFATLHFSSTFVVFVCLSHIFERSLHTTLAKVSLLFSFKQLQRNLFCRSRCKTLQLSYYPKTMRSLSAVLTSSIPCWWMVSHFLSCFILGWYTWVFAFTPGLCCLFLFNTEFHSVHWHVFCECTVMYRTDNGIFSNFILFF